MTTPDRYEAIPAMGIAIAILSSVIVAWLTNDWWIVVVITVALALVQLARFRMRRLQHDWQTRLNASDGDHRTH